jgi:hypothetical protein
MAKRRTDNTMTKRRRTDNTMAKRRTDNTTAKRRTDNTMAKRRTDKTMARNAIRSRESYDVYIYICDLDIIHHYELHCCTSSVLKRSSPACPQNISTINTIYEMFAKGQSEDAIIMLDIYCGVLQHRMSVRNLLKYQSGN